MVVGRRTTAWSSTASTIVTDRTLFTVCQCCCLTSAVCVRRLLCLMSVSVNICTHVSVKIFCIVQCKVIELLWVFHELRMQHHAVFLPPCSLKSSDDLFPARHAEQDAEQIFTKSTSEMWTVDKSFGPVCGWCPPGDLFSQHEERGAGGSLAGLEPRAP